MGKAEELVFGPASEELWAEVERVILTHYSSPDLDAAPALYSSIIAHFIERPPVWPMLVAPPGFMKTCTSGPTVRSHGRCSHPANVYQRSDHNWG